MTEPFEPHLGYNLRGYGLEVGYSVELIIGLFNPSYSEYLTQHLTVSSIHFLLLFQGQWPGLTGVCEC